MMHLKLQAQRPQGEPSDGVLCLTWKKNKQVFILSRFLSFIQAAQNPQMHLRLSGALKRCILIIFFSPN